MLPQPPKKRPLFLRGVLFNLATVLMVVVFPGVFWALDPAKPTPLACLSVVFRNGLTFLSGLILLAFLGMLVVGGFRLLAAGGDPKALGEAKNILSFAFLGVILALSAFLILILISQFTGVAGILEFDIPGECV